MDLQKACFLFVCLLSVSPNYNSHTWMHRLWLTPQVKNVFQKSHLVWFPNILPGNSTPGFHLPDASAWCCCFSRPRSLGLSIYECTGLLLLQKPLPWSSVWLQKSWNILETSPSHAPPRRHHAHLHVCVNTFKYCLPDTSSVCLF